MIKIQPEKSNEKAYQSAYMLEKSIKEGIRQSFYLSGKDLEQKAKQFITDPPKTGRIYNVTVRGKKRTHQASKRGESPANLTGALRASVRYNVSNAGQLIFGAGSEEVPYARYLEEEINRPYLIRAINDQEGNIYQHFLKKIGEEIYK